MTDRVQAASVLAQRFDLGALRRLLAQSGRNVERIAELLVRPQGEEVVPVRPCDRPDAVLGQMLRTGGANCTAAPRSGAKGGRSAPRPAPRPGRRPGAPRASRRGGGAERRLPLGRALRSAKRGLELAARGRRFALRSLPAELPARPRPDAAALSRLRSRARRGIGRSDVPGAGWARGGEAGHRSSLRRVRGSRRAEAAAGSRRGSSSRRRPASTSSAASGSRAATSRAACGRTAGASNWPAKPARVAEAGALGGLGDAETCAAAWSAGRRLPPLRRARARAASDASSSPTGR